MAALAAPAQLPLSVSLPDELNKALLIKDPLLVMVSLEGCPYCKVAREHFLGPMHMQGLPVVQVDMRSAMAVRDLSGQMQTHDQMSKRWRVSIAPTVLFFGRNGQEIADRMEGGYLPDFYAAYLDERLAQARKLLRS